MVEPSGATRSVDVKACPRCGFDHKARTFFRHTDANGADVHPLWYALCPETADPLMLVKDRAGKEKVVKID